MRLIDLDTLKQNLCGDCDMNFPKECRQIGCVKVDKQDILEALRIPIIDAVPVVRCKDCIRYREYTYLGTQKVYVCERDRKKRIFDMNADDFCSRGEKR